jgi:HEAT repeat protein
MTKISEQNCFEHCRIRILDLFRICFAGLADSASDLTKEPMIKKLSILILALCSGFVPAVRAASEAELIAILKSDAPPAEKAITCKRLAIYGGKDAVPLLAPLLADEHLASWARIALEAIPDSAAESALLDSLGKLKGKLLIGVINTLGVRRDPVAGAALVEKLKDNDPEVVAAASVALGRIGGHPAAQALVPLLESAPAAVRPAVAEGCILCAEQYLADSKSADAATDAKLLYDVVRRANVTKQKTIEATRGAILARGNAGISLLVEQLQSADRAFFNMALRTAREIPGREVAKILVAELQRAAADRQGALLLALADRGDAEALPSAINAAKSGAPELRIAAINILDRLGDASCVPVLLDAATADDVKLAGAAKAALVKLPGADVDAAIVALLKQPSVNARRTGIELVGARRITGAIPELLRVADDATIGNASLKILGDLAGPSEIPALLGLLAKTKSASAEAALSTVCARQSDRAACADKLVPAFAQSDAAVKTALLRVLRAAGGAKALAVVRAATTDADAEVKETALRTLCDWPTADALPDVTALAKTATDKKWKILALRGQLRLIPLQSATPEQKMASLKELTPMVERTEEKRLLLAALGEIPTAESLALVAPYLKAPGLKEEAAIAAVGIAEKITGKNPTEVVAAMKAVETRDKKLEKRAHALLAQANAKLKGKKS